jgi:two-component system, sensor histidine kinase and response regulator
VKGTRALANVLANVQRVLAVDHNSVNRELLERLLPRWKMKVRSAASAKQALSLLAESRLTGEKFSTILIDKDLPNPGGFALLSTVREMAPPDLTAILVHSRPLGSADRQRCERLGVMRTILKPFRRSELYEALQECRGEVCEPLVPAAILPAENPRASLRILLAEDNLVNQRLASRLLEKMGHVVTISGNGEMALRLLSEQQFDLIAMDMQMPIMDGLEATEVIRTGEKKSGRHLPIVAMTANAFAEDRLRCERAGMDGYLAKPITAKAIEAEIARVMAAQTRHETHQAPRTG